MTTLTIGDLQAGAKRVGVKLPGGLARADTEAINRLALKVLGVLAEAPDQTTRRKALEKARRMLGQR